MSGLLTIQRPSPRRHNNRSNTVSCQVTNSPGNSDKPVYRQKKHKTGERNGRSRSLRGSQNDDRNPRNPMSPFGRNQCRR